MSELVISTYTGLWRTGLDELLEAYADAGHSRVELLAASPHVDLDDPEVGTSRR